MRFKNGTITMQGSARLLLLVALFFSGCSNKNETPLPAMKFDRTKWEAKDGKNYIYRKQMINDLLTNYTWHGISKDSVIDLLGEPDGTEEDIFMLYHYEQKFMGSFVMSTQSLVVQIDSNDRVVLARTN